MNLCRQDFVVFEVCHLAVETNHPKQHCSNGSIRPLYILISVCKERKGLTGLSAPKMDPKQLFSKLLIPYALIQG